MLWSALEVHLLESHADGAGGDDDDAVAILTEGHSGFDKESEDGEEWLVGLFVHDRGGSWRKEYERAVEEVRFEA